MFDISALKEMKLSELQEIAKSAKTIKFNGVKKETLISLILDHQGVNVDTALDTKTESFMEDSKPKRTRIVPEKKAPIQKAVKRTLFETEEIVAKTNFPTENTAAETLPIPNKEEPSSTQDIESVDKKVGKIIKFNKSAYEKKLALKKDKEEVKETKKDNDRAIETTTEEKAEVVAPT